MIATTTTTKTTLTLVLLCCLTAPAVQGFHIIVPELITVPSSLHEVATHFVLPWNPGDVTNAIASCSSASAPETVTVTSSVMASSTSSLVSSSNLNLLDQYKSSLLNHPLPTKMVTGGVLAVVGDAIAQTASQRQAITNDDEKSNEFSYDTLRAFSFMIFDMCYRALQHISFPIIVQHCHGQYINAIASSIPGVVSANADAQYYFSTMEQTLASQLGIVPFLYYPVFFTLTGFVQGLTPAESIQRAKENFVPLMKRNLLFWIPVQFIQFTFVEENLQIPFLSICGLGWTFILSIMAGSTKQYGKKVLPIAVKQDEEETQLENQTTTNEIYVEVNNYCITGTEINCEIDPDHIFPGIFETNDTQDDNNNNNNEEETKNSNTLLGTPKETTATVGEEIKQR